MRILQIFGIFILLLTVFLLGVLLSIHESSNLVDTSTMYRQLYAFGNPPSTLKPISFDKSFEDTAILLQKLENLTNSRTLINPSKFDNYVKNPEKPTVNPIIPLESTNRQPLVAQVVEETEHEGFGKSVDSVAKNGLDDILKDIRRSPAVQSALSAALQTLNTRIDTSPNSLPMSQYLYGQNIDFSSNRKASFPIIVLTGDRIQLLRQTLNSLLQVAGVTADSILVIQDGEIEQTARMVQDEFHVKIKHNSHDNQNLRVDGAVKIANHYKFSLSYGFEFFFTSPAIIIVEDDFLFSPDFYDYLNSIAPLLEFDQSSFIASSWNDNGFSTHVRDSRVLYRTDFFPGLGWLLPRALYERELKSAWPNSHWDHWLRDGKVNKGRECVFPQMPRSFHNGVQGTFMNLDMHNKYFADIALNTDKALSSKLWRQSEMDKDWLDGDGYTITSSHTSIPLFLWADKSVYEARLLTMISRCRHVTSIKDMIDLNDELACIWIHVMDGRYHTTIPDQHSFKSISEYFNLWHEGQRTSHEGQIHEFHFQSNYFILINTIQEASSSLVHKVDYSRLKPAHVPVFTPSDFKNIKPAIDMINPSTKVLVADLVDSNCDDVCKSAGLTCKSTLMSDINNCDVMKKYFKSCIGGCDVNFGYEQPAFDEGSGKCLVSADAKKSTCSAHFKTTRRLCPCV